MTYDIHPKVAPDSRVWGWSVGSIGYQNPGGWTLSVAEYGLRAEGTKTFLAKQLHEKIFLNSLLDEWVTHRTNGARTGKIELS